MRRIRYRTASFDNGNLRRPEQQAMLLAKAAHKAWEAWAENQDCKEDPNLTRAMHTLRQEVTQTDIFFSGYEIGRDEPTP